MVLYQDITINQGTSFYQTFDFVNINNTPLNFNTTDIASLQGRISKSYISKNYTDIEIYIVDAVNGKLALSISSDNTSMIDPGTYVYEVVMINSLNFVTKIIEGKAFINPGISVTKNQYHI
jgi:hypothetical protein